MIKIKSNLTAGIIGIFISLILIIMIPFNIKMGSNDTMMVNQRFIPYLTSLVMLVMSIIMIGQSLIFKKDKEITIKLSEELRTFIYIFGIFLLVVVMKYLGYLIGSVFIISFSFFYFKCRKWYYYVGSSLFVLLTYLFFSELLHIPLP
jgi:putative tricarboxylic transport membrane protein